MKTQHRPLVVAVVLLCAAALVATAAEPDIYDAVRMGDTELVKALLDTDAQLVGLRNERGLTPLHVAATSHDPSLVKLLLAAGADPNMANAAAETPLHWAARRPCLEPLRVLIAGGADVDARDARGRTPLHVLGVDARDGAAEQSGLLDAAARVLLEAGADPGLLDHSGTRAWPHPAEPDRDGPPAGYPSYDDIVQTLQGYVAQYPDLCELHDLGPTAGPYDRRVWALKISDNPSTDEDEPEFKYISTMHGDEIVGVEMCLYLTDDLLTGYGSDPRLTNLINEIEIWIIPVMNPDGYMDGRRGNHNGIDLNRDFPEGSNGEPNTTAGRTPETVAIMNWSLAQSFTLAANFHGGVMVVNYPFDNDGQGSVFSPTPDEDLFVYISEEYSRHNLPMWNGSWYHGITNGAAWYAISGGMQDWDYRYMGGNEVTIELSDIKSPSHSQIPGFWDDNRESMLAYLETCLIGVRGIVTDDHDGRPLAATITVVGRDHDVFTDPDVGDYHRMLLPGTYDLRFEAVGYEPRVIQDVAVSSGPATCLDVALTPPARVVYPNGGEELTVNVPVEVTWVGKANAQFHVQHTANFGQSEPIEDGFESGAIGSAYATGGDQPWYATAGSAHTGSYSARAGAISHNQQSWLTRPAGGGPLSFWYRVSSESNWDWFDFYIDSNREIHSSGEVGWTLYATSLPPGEHVLRWEYTKDVNTSNGSDTAWIDDLSLTEDATLWSDIVALTPPGAASAQWTPTSVSTDCKVRVRPYVAGVYGEWDESDATFAVVEGPQYPLGDLNCDHSVDFGDINPFVLALTDPAGYAAAFPDCNIMNADINEDGKVDFGDINPFVALLSGNGL